MDEDELTCAGCGMRERVVWCPVYNVSLCPQCLWVRNEQELKPTGLINGLLTESICDCCPPI